MSEDRKLILKMLQENRISVEEAEQLLSALDKKAEPAAGPKEETLFQKTAPKMEQFMGSISSVIDSVTQQLPNIEKRFEGWFQNRQDAAARAGAAADATAAAEGHAELHKEQSVINIEPEVTKIRCFQRLGDLSVEGHSGEHIHVVLEKQFGSVGPEERIRIEDIKLLGRQDGELLMLELDGADGFKAEKGKAVHVRLQVPAAYDLELATTQQDVHLNQLSHAQGKVHIHTEAGDIELRSVALKQVDLESQSGNITADQASELLQVRSQSGDVRVKGSIFAGEVRSQSGNIYLEGQIQQQLKVESRSSDLHVQLLEGKGRLDLQTQSGDIELNGKVQAETVLNSSSGDLQCDLTITESASVSLNTYSGDVDLIVRPGSACKVDAETQSGDIECRLELSGKESDDHKLSGSLGSGDGLLRIKTQSGDVLIS